MNKITLLLAFPIGLYVLNGNARVVEDFLSMPVTTSILERRCFPKSYWCDTREGKPSPSREVICADTERNCQYFYSASMEGDYVCVYGGTATFNLAIKCIWQTPS